MTTTGRRARVDLLEYDDLSDGGVREIYEEMMGKTGGSVPDFYKAIAGSPIALQLVHRAAGTVASNGFDKMIRELVTITVAQETRTVLTWTLHYENAVRMGAPERLLAIIGTPEIEAEPAPIGPVVRYARLLARGEHIDEALIDELKSVLGDRAFIDLTTQIAFAGFICRIVDALGVPLPEGYSAKPFVRSA